MVLMKRSGMGSRRFYGEKVWSLNVPGLLELTILPYYASSLLLTVVMLATRNVY